MAKTILSSPKGCFIIIIATVLMLFHLSLAGMDDCDKSNVILNCSGLNLRIFPSQEEVPYQCQNLDLSNNLITSISRLNFSKTNTIETLNLANNIINKIQAYAFEQMTNLVTLDLSGNKLDGHGMNEDQFQILGKLRKLSMQRNPLRFIGKSTFNFIELPTIKYLDLSFCSISHIEAEGLILPDLEYLDLSWNELTVFSKDSFRMMDELRILDLSHNQIQILNEVPHLPEIRILNFDYNEISNVSLRDPVWYLADSLEELCIRGNDIMRFSEDSFPWNLETLKGIYFDDNPMQCDCRMKWFVKDENLKDLLERNFTIMCQYPSTHKGKNLLTIPVEELKCSTPLYKILILLGLSLVVVFCLTLLVFLIVRRKRNKRTQKPKVKVDRGSCYTAVFTKDEDDVKVHISDGKRLIPENGIEFDV